MNRIAIIPARSGSKRIPNKNVLPLCGKPMLQWTIEAAIESGAFHRVLVSTDSQEYADLAVNLGAEAPFLRDTALDDHCPISHATARALEQAGDFFGEEYRTVVQLMPNCPLRTSATIVNLVSRFERDRPASLISGFRYGWMNPNWAHEIDSSGKPIPVFPERMTMRSQDCPALYCPTGAVWVIEKERLLTTRNFYTEGWQLEPIPWQESVDIDDESDWAMAETLLQQRLDFSVKDPSSVS